MIVSNKVCVLIGCLDQTVSLLQEVYQALLAAVMLKLHYSKVRRNEAIVVALVSKRVYD